MLTSLQLTNETVLELSKTVLRSGGYVCDWTVDGQTCQVVLACWKAYQEHLYMHCRRAKKSECQISWCNLPIAAKRFSTSQLLFEHVEKHLDRSPVPCPISGCPSAFPFATCSRLVQDHFLEVHRALEGISVEFPSPSIAPLWQPSLCHPPAPPDLPHRPFLASILTGNVQARLFNSLKGLSDSQPPPSSQSSFVSPVKRRMLATKHPQPSQVPSDSKPQHFDNLPASLNKEKAWNGSLETMGLTRVLGPAPDVSRPQPTLSDGPPVIISPPRSIFFDIWVRDFEEIYGKLESEEEDNNTDRTTNPAGSSNTHALLPPSDTTQLASTSTAAPDL